MERIEFCEQYDFKMIENVNYTFPIAGNQRLRGQSYVDFPFGFNTIYNRKNKDQFVIEITDVIYT